MNRSDRDPTNENALIDLDDIVGNLRMWPKAVPQEELRRILSKLNLIQVLQQVRRKTAYFFHSKQSFEADKDGIVFSFWRLSYLATLAILYCPLNGGDGLDEERFKELTLIVNRYHNDYISKDIDGKNIKSNKADLERYIYRTMYLENVFNGRIGYLAARNRIIFRELADEGKNHPPFELAETFTKRTGVDFAHYSDVGMAIASMFQNHDIVTRDCFKGLKRKELEVVFDNFFKFNSQSIEDFQQNFDDNPFKLSPFLTFPLVKLDQNSYICPVLPALIFRSVDLYHIFFAALNEKFSRWYGAMFELYVGRLLKRFFEDKDVFCEVKYNKDQDKSVDWLVKEGKTLLLFECKNKRLNVKGTVVDGDTDQLRTDVEGAIAEAVYQLDKTIKLIRSKSEHFKDFFETKDFEPVVVLSEFINENSLSQRRIVADILKQKYALEIDFFYHVIDAASLERSLPYRNFKKGRLFRNLLREKETSFEYRFRTFGTFLFYRQHKKIPENTFLQGIFQEMHQKALEKFFKN